MNRLNLLEVYYDVYRTYGKSSADAMLTELESSPLHVQSELTESVFREAGRLKATWRISPADSVALAETMVRRGTLLTSDHHEFDVIEKSEPIVFCWIR